jgi:integrase
MATLSMASPWRDPRTGIYYLRKRVPSRFAGVAGVPTGIVKWSLGTKDSAEARRLWPEALARWAAQEAEWERRRNTVEATPKVIAQVVSTWAAAASAGAVKLPTTGDASDVFDPLELPEANTPANVALMLATVEPHVDEACRLSGVTVTDDSRLRLRDAMIYAVRSAYLQADMLGLGGSDVVRPLEVLRRHLPPPKDIPEVAAPPPVVPEAQSLRGLFAAWRAVAVVKPRTITETEYAIETLIAYLGHDDAAKVAKADLIGWRDSMKAAGKNNNTWNNRHSLVSQVFARAVADERLPTNPADGLRLPKAAPAQRLPYSDADAVRILSAARSEDRPTRRWAHWIMAFTGMRVAEVLQLAVSDIRKDGEIHYFMVEDNSDEGKSVKTGERRHVPIHPALLAEGLLDYAATLPAQGPLFPDKQTDRDGFRGTRGWQAVGRWVRDVVGISHPRKVPNHSWRHRVEDELRAAGVDESLRDAILGHARKTTGRHYGIRGESLRSLADAVRRIPVPVGLNVATQ